ncbi:ATP-binding cassette subfamily B protein [Tumebacillus sp. BK434]|uniref:ABC transporter ATP-binding protein n=1 Tax=Tumebacillus sp. BK434 TaxID=2512169 RepID=UPI001042DF12|nr:ABC transporter ATP-binding protein [Tumebacillus sp. BK434]TCP54648.1 ATP-binding cassette subfamily B protein [Tumebacillus sp. BK434]
MGRFYTNYDWGQNGKKPELKKESLVRIYRYFLPYWKLLAGVVFCILAAAGLGLLQPLLIKWIVDTAIPDGNLSMLNILAVAMVLAAMLQGLIGVMQTYLNSRIGQGVMFDIRNQMYRHLHQMSIRFFTSTKTGDIMSRVNNDVNGLQQVVTDTIAQSLNNVLISVTTLVTMFWLDWRLALVSILLLPLFILPTRRVGKLNYNAKKETQKRMGDMSSLMQETLSVSGALLVKAFVRQEDELRKFEGINKELMRLQIRQSMIGRWFFMFVSIISTAGPAIIYWYGGHLVIDQDITIGTVIAFTAFLNRLYGPVAALANIQVNILGSVALFERLFEYLDLPIEIKEKPHALKLQDVQGRVAFEHVTFRYQAERDVLRDLSFVIEPGQVVALVGPSGSGKTTVSSLIPRLYDPTEGRVLLDGHDLRDLELKTIGEQIGMVTQETFLFHASIRDNLRYGRPDASDEEVVAAAKAAYIHNLIVSLPEGYDTIVGERGHKLSGGEKQRMAIARVILKAPKILILDEATSALDSHSEHEIQQALEELMSQKSRTSLVIAHRLSTILAADQILVLEDGRLVEAGRHEQLLVQGGLYASLYRQQFEGDSEL